MSFNAMSWAVKQDCATPTAKLVLLMLANYADEAGSCYPSKEHLAKLCSCDTRTIHRALRYLIEAGMLAVYPRFGGDGKQTSNRYKVQVDESALGETQPPDGRGQHRTDRGDKNVPPRGDKNEGVGVTNMYPNTVRDIQSNTHNVRLPKNRAGYPPEFEVWWSVYPRRDGSKAKALDAWQKACSRYDPAWLLEVTMNYSQVRKGKDPKFTPHATTWLNQARFETVAEEARPERTTNLNQLAG